MIDSNTSKAVWLVIPCYREKLRLPNFLPGLCARLEAEALPVIIQVVDDGSPASEQSELAHYLDRQRASHRILRPLAGYAINRGKGHAIRFGWDQATDDVSWLGFVDADGAVPADEVDRVIKSMLSSAQQRIIAAVREHQEGALVKRHPLRHVGSRLFQRWVKICHHLPIRDTQCGLKFIPSGLYRSRRDQWKQSRYAFDIELLIEARRKGLPIEAIPVTWQEQAVSRLHLPAALRLFWHAWRCGR